MRRLAGPKFAILLRGARLHFLCRHSHERYGHSFPHLSILAGCATGSLRDIPSRGNRFSTSALQALACVVAFFRRAKQRARPGCPHYLGRGCTSQIAGFVLRSCASLGWIRVFCQHPPGVDSGCSPEGPRPISLLLRCQSWFAAPVSCGSGICHVAFFAIGKPALLYWSGDPHCFDLCWPAPPST